MINVFVIFGQYHTHSFDGKAFDKDTVAVIQAPNHEEARKVACHVFGDEFHRTYTEEDFWQRCYAKYFPKGFVEV